MVGALLDTKPHIQLFINLFIYLSGVLDYTQEFFTQMTAISTMVVENQGELTGNPQPSVGCHRPSHIHC